MSIHALLEQSRRRLAMRTCPAATTPATPITAVTPAAPAAAPASELLQAA